MKPNYSEREREREDNDFMGLRDINVTYCTWHRELLGMTDILDCGNENILLLNVVVIIGMYVSVKRY